MLRHNRRELALHDLRSGTGRPLLLLHGLGESAQVHRIEQYGSWLGPIFGLDLCGHGKSDFSLGHGYSSEGMMSDVDIAVAELEECAIAGRGFGAYLALMMAGARPTQVFGAILSDGPGLGGGGPEANLLPVSWEGSSNPGSPDPYALVELSSDVRPPEYAIKYAKLAARNTEFNEPIFVAARSHPAWLAAVIAEPNVTTSTLDQSLAAFGANK